MSTFARIFKPFSLLLLPSLLFAGELEEYLIPKGYSVGELDIYLYDRGYLVMEGYMTERQKGDFRATLASYENIHTILEVGFNAGHSAEFFLTECPGALLNSIDICSHDYTPVGCAYIQEKFNGRFAFRKGDSTVILPKLAQKNRTYDLIFIDGCHTYDVALKDIQNARSLAHKNSYLWIDDWENDVQKAGEYCIAQGIIELIKIHTDNDRPWAEARYIYNN